jgi:urease accessory protein
VITPTGYLRLAAARKKDKTIFKETYTEGAFKITRPVYLTSSGEAYGYMMNPGGGYLDGDSYKISIVLEEGAEVLLTTQSSTKIYKTRTRPAIQEMDIHLKKESLLEYLPDPVIAYQHACFKQKTIVQMDKGASLVSCDIFTPGWSPDGTLFRYDLLQSRMEVYLEQQLVLFDHIKLEPDEDMTGIGYMEGYTHFGTMIIIDERVNKAFIEELHVLFEPLTETRIGVSMLAVPGFALRALANSTQAIEHIQSVTHELIRKKILGKEPVFLRKY